MSTQHHHTQPANIGAAHGTLKDYVTGFILSVILTAIPFWLVLGGVLESKVATVGLILAFGLAQILVHMVYFLHMNTRSEGGWVVLAAIFTIITLVIALVGSIWVMNHLHDHMMPHKPGAEFVPESARDVRR